jgi:hypothetical protein
LKSKWRDYLKGKIKVEDKDKMNWEIRKRAKQMMEDLLLIAEKTNERQRIAIFKNPKNRNELVIPLARELFNRSAFDHGKQEYEDITRLGAELTAMGKQYDWIKLIEDKDYRRRWEMWLENNK